MPAPPARDGAVLYSAFGLTVSSELSFPELPRGGDSADVFVREGDVPQHLESPVATGVLFEAHRDRFLLRVPSVARYLIERGTAISFSRAAGADEDAVRDFCLDGAFGPLLRQRGYLVLHAAAVETPAGAVVIAGASGAGKSTIAASLVRRGFPLIADDLVAIEVDQSARPIVHPSVPRLKLWADAAAHLGEDLSLLRPLRPKLAKFAVPTRSQFSARSLPVAHVFVLDVHTGLDVLVRDLAGAERYAALRDVTRGAHLIRKLGYELEHLKAATALANAARVSRVSRPYQPLDIEPLANIITSALS